MARLFTLVGSSFESMVETAFPSVNIFIAYKTKSDQVLYFCVELTLPILQEETEELNECHVDFYVGAYFFCRFLKLSYIIYIEQVCASRNEYFLE